MNDCFTDMTEIPKYILGESVEILPPNSRIAHTIEYYTDHPIILIIKQHCKKTAGFSFKSVSTNVMKDENPSLKTNKATGSHNIPANIMKTTIKEIYHILTYLFNFTVLTCTFKGKS